MKLGEIIREYRLQNKMSMGDFARMSGISKPYVSMLEADKNSNGGKSIAPSVETLQKTSRVIGISLDELLRKLGDEEINLKFTEYTPDEFEIVNYYRKLSSEDKNFVADMIRRLCGNASARGTSKKNSGVQNKIKNNFGVVGGDFNSNVIL